MMQEKHPLFREIPPWLLVLQVLSMLNLPTDIPYTFQRQDMKLDASPTIVALLEPYYIPCKAKQYLEYTPDHRWITILRHLLLPHGYVLISQETTRDKKKAIFYSIERAYSTLREAIQMDFS
jgi:hypothetical protein